jgi:hypothetical protein
MSPASNNDFQDPYPSLKTKPDNKGTVMKSSSFHFGGDRVLVWQEGYFLKKSLRRVKGWSVVCGGLRSRRRADCRGM